MDGSWGAFASSADETTISQKEAARFLLQAQFSARPLEIAEVQRLGFDGWLSEQFKVKPGQSGSDWLDEAGYGAITPKGEYFWPMMGDHMAWNQFLTAPDQVRRRTSFALSEFFVVSLNPIEGFWPPYMIAGYWDMLNQHAFGNFRDLLEAVTLNPAMGMYLNTKGNLKEDKETGREPDENYAREIMQLFTIGLYELNPDGTLRLDANGQPIETYTQDDIVNLARVFTGYDHNFDNVTKHDVDWLSYPVPSTEFCRDSMKVTRANHSYMDVTFLGLTIPGGTDAKVKLGQALDHLFNHPNTGPFFSYQMIQRLVTGSPSPAYVKRVADTFADNGKGVRGDLKAVWRAVLMDPEARAMPGTDGAILGKVREPVLRLTQWAHTVGVKSENNKWEMHSTARDDRSLGQSPLRAPSVFNYFRPGYVPPQTQMAKEGIEAPEFQIHNESSTAGYINFLSWMINTGYNDVKPTYDRVPDLGTDVSAVIDWLDLHMTAGQLSDETKLVMTTALENAGQNQEVTPKLKRQMWVAALMLVMASPEYIIQK
ncbi:DUF1800 domain-containing protein [Parvularcula sp. LCG005]|uniref:DUF1800 domain-containing protein n=1 Tax=Parvularcula sp. LCG005 TaxID=3078805 RepID=UPI002942DCE1|nr:DUF1800 domain-containing protein [Parvularcula sp. LCG005]WOI52773.1 DUF1800 domain-containing protein [Parvularcula sp. LCG005]